MKLAFLLSILTLLVVSSSAAKNKRKDRKQVSKNNKNKNNNDEKNDKQERIISSSCSGSKLQVVITIMTDKYPGDTSWELRRGGGALVMEKSSNFDKNTKHVAKKCVRPGKFEFRIKDSVGDGLCAKGGSCGYYKVEVQEANGSTWQALKGGERMGKGESNFFYVGSNQKSKIASEMTDRDKGYLNAHNERRKTYHQNYGVSYVPLKWSEDLKDLSQVWADKLLDSCGVKSVYHDPNAEYGESATGQIGGLGSSLGKMLTPDANVKRFVERESNWEWPRNTHLTNAIWRPSTYVGCAEATKNFQDSKGQRKFCQRTVCRYAKSGNCSWSKFKDENGNVDFEKAMMQDDSDCGPFCPPEGCFN